MVEKDKSCRVTLLKLIATVMVVMVHAENVYGYANQTSEPAIMILFNRLAGTGVPIFFVISCYYLFHKKRKWRDNIKAKTKTLLVPVLIWELFYTLFEAIGHAVMPANFEDVGTWSLHRWLSVLLVPTKLIYDPLWFVISLYVINLLLPIGYFIIEKCNPYLIFLLAAMVWGGLSYQHSVARDTGVLTCWDRISEREKSVKYA